MSKLKRRGGRPRSKRSVSIAPVPLGGDHGTGTAAATMGTTLQPITDANGSNPNHMGQRRRVSVLEQYRDRGILTDRQMSAGLALLKSFEKTQQGRPAINPVQVDHSPKPDAAIDMLLSRVGGYHDIVQHLPNQFRSAVMSVAVHDQPIEAPNRGYYSCALDTYKLLSGLDKIAEGIENGPHV